MPTKITRYNIEDKSIGEGQQLTLREEIYTTPKKNETTLYLEIEQENTRSCHCCDNSYYLDLNLTKLFQEIRLSEWGKRPYNG